MKTFANIVNSACEYAEREYVERVVFYRCSEEKKNEVYDKLKRLAVDKMLDAHLKRKG